MTRKYLVLTEIDGQFKMLAFSSNAADRELTRECNSLLTNYFWGKRVAGFILTPWPLTSAETSSDGKL